MNGKSVARTHIQMSINWSITNCTNELLVLTKCNVIFRLVITILLGEMEINYADLIATHFKPHVEGT